MRSIATAFFMLAASAVYAEPLPPSKPSETWTCSYPGYGPDKKSVTTTFAIKGDKLVGELGTSYSLIENNGYAVIAVEHLAKPQQSAQRGTVRIFASMVIIDKTFGQFIHMVGEIGDEPGYRKGRCIKD